MNIPNKCSVDGCGGTLTALSTGGTRCPFCERRKEWAAKNIPGLPPATCVICGAPTPLAKSKSGKGTRRLKYCKPCAALVKIKAYRDKVNAPKVQQRTRRSA